MVRKGGSWVARISGEPIFPNTTSISMFYYFGLDGVGSLTLKSSPEENPSNVTLTGSTFDLGNYEIRVINSIHWFDVSVLILLGNDSDTFTQRYFGKRIEPGKVWKAKDYIHSRIWENLRTYNPVENPDAVIEDLMQLNDETEPSSNFFAFQKLFVDKFQVFFSYLRSCVFHGTNTMGKV